LQQERHQVAAAMWIDQRHRFVSSQRCLAECRKKSPAKLSREGRLHYRFLLL